MARIVSQSNATAANTAGMPADNSVKLSEQEQGRLVRAIESAIEVGEQEQFHAWMRGPFQALLPHESMVCVDLGARGEVRQVDYLHHTLVDAVATDFLCHPEHGLAVYLARLLRGRTQMTCALDADDIDALLATGDGPRERGQLHNAVIHLTKFLPGAGYFFVLVNMPREHFDRCPHLFKLLSLHLKMALSRSIAAQERKNATLLTERELEILHLMRAGKSNREISAILGISAITLKNHINKLYRKLDVQNRTDAVAKGLPLPVLKLDKEG